MLGDADDSADVRSDVVTEIDSDASSEEYYEIDIPTAFPSVVVDAPRPNELETNRYAESSTYANINVNANAAPKRVYSTYSNHRHPWPIHRSDSHFQVDMFLEQFFMHIFYPLSLPMYMATRGYLACRNQGLIGVSRGTIVFGILLPLSLWSITGLFAFQRQNLEDQGFKAVELVMIWALYLIHRLSIGIKYAFMCKRQFNWFITQPDKKVAQQFSSKAQLISGWLDLGELTVRDELETTQLRLGCDTRKTFFKLPCTKSVEWLRWQHLLVQGVDENSKNREGETQFEKFLQEVAIIKQKDESSDTGTLNPVSASQSDFVIFVDGFTVLQATIRYASSKDKSWIVFPASILVSVALASITGLSRVSCPLILQYSQFGNPSNSTTTHDMCGYSFFGGNNFGYAYSILAMFVMICVSIPLISLFLVAVIDFNRRRQFLHRFGKLIHVQHHVLFEGQTVQPERSLPSIKVDDPDEVRAWTLCRLVLHDFGADRMKRFNMYISTALLMVFILIVWFILDFARYYNEKLELQVSTVVHLTLIYGMSTVGFAALVLLIGAQANIEGEYHSKALYLSKIYLTNKLELLRLKKSQNTLSATAAGRLQVQNAPASFLAENTETVLQDMSEVSNCYSNQANLDTLEECIAELDRGSQLVSVLRKVRPYSLLGVAAEKEYASSLLSVAAAAIAFVVQEIYF